MNFLALIIKNLLRRRARSLLTLVGVSIGIAAVVALTSIAWGFERSWGNVYKARGTDMVITKTIFRSTMPTPFPATIQREIKAMPGVKSVAGLLSEVFSVESAPSLILIAWEPGTTLWDHVRLSAGRIPAPDSTKEVMIGAVAAEMLHKTVGSEVQIETDEYVVTGIFSSDSLAENGSIILPLPTMQALMHQPDMVNFFDLQLEPGTTPAAFETLKETIKSRYEGLTAFSPGAVAQNNIAIQIAKAMSLATSAIALLVGAVGIMNTILMSVFERMHEIGVLLALGWSRQRIRWMILLESLVLSFAGGILGVGLGALTSQALQASPWVRGKIEGEISLTLIITSLFIAVALGAIGGLYPAWKGSRMSPATALRHE